MTINKLQKKRIMTTSLKKVMQFLKEGWPNRLEKCFVDVHSHYQDLEEVEGCILFQDRVIVPDSMKMCVLKLLHRNHTGMHKIKQLARRTVYWFGMNRDIEDFVKTCRICQQTTALCKKPPHSSWIPTNKPFSRIHADFFYFEKKVYLLVVDSYSKWIEVELMRFGTDHRKVIKIFLSIFARYGLPDVLVTDGGPPFNSEYFINFFEKQGVIVMKSPPYHPSSNGQAERLVRLVKDALKKFLLDPEIRRLDEDERIIYFLMNYRNICLGKDGSFPSEHLLTYKPKTTLDLINPKYNYKRNLTQTHEDKRETILTNTDSTSNRFTNLQKGDLIYYKNTNKTDIRQWLPAKFLKHISSNVLQISLGGRVLSAHRRQVKVPVSTRGKCSTRLVFHENTPDASVQAFDSNNNSSPEGQEQAKDAADLEYLGFAADSFLFGEDLAPATSSKGEQALHKRKREEDNGETDSDSDFYGYAADSLIFEQFPAFEDAFRESSSTSVKPVRSTKRKIKKRRKVDYLYY